MRLLEATCNKKEQTPLLPFVAVLIPIHEILDTKTFLAPPLIRPEL
jgi:hypothetical protein